MILLDAQRATAFTANLEKFEGRTNYLYLDGPGNVTVGVGCMLPSASASIALAWGGIGTITLAATEWQTVKTATPGLMAVAYRSLTTLRLPEAEIDRLRDERIASTESDLISAIRGVSGFPMCVAQAMLDMAFNMGAGKLHSQFFGPGCKFGPALYAGDWQTAAAESIRHGIQASRNEYVRDLIMTA